MRTRVAAPAASLAAAVLWVGLLSALLPAESDVADLLLDLNTQRFPYPLTIQNVMWVVFFVAAGELVVRHRAGDREEDQLRLCLLPEDEETVLRREDVAPHYRRVRQSDEILDATGGSQGSGGSCATWRRSLSRLPMWPRRRSAP